MGRDGKSLFVAMQYAALFRSFIQGRGAHSAAPMATKLYTLARQRVGYVIPRAPLMGDARCLLLSGLVGVIP